MADDKGKSNFTSSLSQSFSLSSNSLIMGILRDSLYSDKIETPIKEILSNARDAMREIKNVSDRIDVTLPTKENPVLKIRDFGTGLSKERINEVFRFYGRSTKENQNEQTGHFGLGAKSPFAYTDSFIVISYFNGQETHYVSHLGHTREGTIDVIYEGPTSKKNGVEVQIPVLKETDLPRFISSVFKVTAFWEEREKPHILNAPQSKPSEYFYNPQRATLLNLPHLIIVDALTKGEGAFNQIRLGVLIDGLYYSMPDHELFKGIFDRFNGLSGFNSLKCSFILRLDNKSVDIAPNREQIAITEKTLSSVGETFKTAERELFSFVKDTMEGADFYALPNLVKTYERFLNLGPLYFNNHQKYGLRISAVPYGPLRIDHKEISKLEVKLDQSQLNVKKERAYFPIEEILSFSDLNENSIQKRIETLLLERGVKEAKFTLVEKTELTENFLSLYPHSSLNDIKESETKTIKGFQMDAAENKLNFKLEDLKHFRHVFLYPAVGFSKEECSINDHFISRHELSDAAMILRKENIAFIRIPSLEDKMKVLKEPNVSSLKDFEKTLNGPLQEIRDYLSSKFGVSLGLEPDFHLPSSAVLEFLEREKERLSDKRFLRLLECYFILEGNSPRPVLPKFIWLSIPALRERKELEERKREELEALWAELLIDYPFLSLMREDFEKNKEGEELLFYLEAKFKSLKL